MSSIPTSSPTMPAGSRFGRHFILGAAFGGLIIVGGATALWARDDGGSSSSGSSVLPAPVPGSSDRHTESALVFVNSEAEAAEMQGAIADANAIRSAMGEGPVTMVVSAPEATGPSVIGRRANQAEGYDFESVTTPATTEPSVIGRRANEAEGYDFATVTTPATTEPSVIGRRANEAEGYDFESVTTPATTGASANFNTGGSTTDDGPLSLGEDEGAVAGLHGE